MGAQTSQRPRRSLVITGATGYLGRPLAALAHARGHHVRSFVRPGSRSKAASVGDVVSGDPFSIDQLAAAIEPGDTLVPLIGTPRPTPAKAQQFLDIDLASMTVAAAAAAHARAAHIVYVSVAHPAPVMRAYIDARSQAESLILATGIPVTILRPWYVLGPGHWWPYALQPLYWLFERIPSKRDVALRLGLVTRQQMLTALMRAIEDGPERAGTWEVPAIRAASLATS